MNPSEFLSFASKLAGDGQAGAAGYRSAVSRAYYCAFLTALDLIESQLGIPAKWGTVSEHQVVQRFLQGSQVPEAMEVGQALCNLHASRKSADYDMDEAQVEDQEESSLCVARAEKILEGIANCSTMIMKQKLKAGISQYRTINKIVGK